MRTISTLASVVGQNIDTFIGNARIHGDFPAALAEQLEDLKRRSRRTRKRSSPPRGSLPARSSSSSRMALDGNGAGSAARPVFHLDVGLGRLTHIVAKARLSSAFLWEHEIGICSHAALWVLGRVPPGSLHHPQSQQGVAPPVSLG